MTPDKAIALREAAERATPGPWEIRKAITVNAGSADEVAGGEVWATGRNWTITDWCEYPDAAYIALADPPTILALLAERERLRGALEAAREGLSIAAGWARSKPDSDRARAKIKRGLDAVRAALNPAKAARQALEATEHALRMGA